MVRCLYGGNREMRIDKCTTSRRILNGFELIHFALIQSKRSDLGVNQRASIEDYSIHFEIRFEVGGKSGRKKLETRTADYSVILRELNPQTMAERCHCFILVGAINFIPHRRLRIIRWKYQRRQSRAAIQMSTALNALRF
ncbi:hypothetical protein CBL_04189 [Carabus blaptoides fortunei]